MLPNPNRKVPESISNPVFFADPSRTISKQLSEGARQSNIAGNEPVIRQFLKVYRIGLMSGIGFTIPYGEARDNINLVQIVAETHSGNWAGLCTMRFCKATEHDDCMVSPDIDVIRTVKGVHLRDLTATYDRETGVGT